MHARAAAHVRARGNVLAARADADGDAAVGGNGDDAPWILTFDNFLSDEEIETLVAPNGDLVFARALHARHAPALGDVLEGASVVEVQATSGDLELPAVRLVVAGD